MQLRSQVKQKYYYSRENAEEAAKILFVREEYEIMELEVLVDDIRDTDHKRVEEAVEIKVQELIRKSEYENGYNIYTDEMLSEYRELAKTEPFPIKIYVFEWEWEKEKEEVEEVVEERIVIEEKPKPLPPIRKKPKKEKVEEELDLETIINNFLYDK